MFEYLPVPKPVSKPKEKPKYKKKRPKKKTNSYLYRGRIIPNQRERTHINPKDYNKMIEVFGNYCQECGYTPIAAHHLVFRSSMGTGNWRNLAPLCKRCHDRAHSDFEFAEYLRNKRAKEYGAHFGQDKYSLFMDGLISNTTDQAYERFMQKEREQCEAVCEGINRKDS